MYRSITLPSLASIIMQTSERGSVPSVPMELEPAFKRIMMYLFVGMRGGQNRARIVELLKKEPCNANKIAEALRLDYKTIRHHLKLLEENGVVVTSSADAYGSVYFLTVYFDKYFPVIRTMWV